MCGKFGAWGINKTRVTDNLNYFNDEVLGCFCWLFSLFKLISNLGHYDE